MPWRHTSPMDQTTQFIADYLRRTLSITELCERYHVSRKTGYKWIDRYLKHGPLGLEERSGTPHSSPHHTPTHVVDALLEPRRHHPAWGAKNLLSMLQNRHPSRPLPARSTGGAMLRRHGVVPKPRRRRHLGHPGTPTSPILAPNAGWSADVKGHVKTGAGLYGDPLTVADGDSRLRLGCQALAATPVVEAQPVFTRLLTACGWPTRSRPDTGVPLATNTLGRLSQLSAWGAAWGSSRTASRPATPSQTAAMSAGLVPSQLRPPAPRPHAMRSLHGRCPPHGHRWRSLTASRGATSAPMGACDGSITGATYHTPAWATRSASRTSTMAPRLSTSVPPHAGGSAHAIGASQMPRGDAHAAGDGHPGRRTLLFPMSPAGHTAGQPLDYHANGTRRCRTRFWYSV